MVTVLVSGLALAGCTANPPPPVESTDSPKPTTTVPTKNTVVVGIDEIGQGFNPHLLSDQSPVNAAVTSMVLPSPFRPIQSPTVPGGTDWVPDESLLVTADEERPAGVARPPDLDPHLHGGPVSGLSVASIRGAHHSILLVSDLEGPELTQLSTTVSVPLVDQLVSGLIPPAPNAVATLDPNTAIERLLRRGM